MIATTILHPVIDSSTQAETSPQMILLTGYDWFEYDKVVFFERISEHNVEEARHLDFLFVFLAAN